MILKILSKIPIFGVVIVIINSYVWGGNFKSDEKFAPLLTWCRVLAPAITIAFAFALTYWILGPASVEILQGKIIPITELNEFSQRPGQLATSILPNVLGFGIGVYALVFTLSGKLINNFQTTSAKNGSTALAINSDMAYPLLILIAAIAAGVIQQRFSENSRWAFTSWFLFWYSLILSICLVSSLFRLGEVSIVEKID